MAGKTTRTAKTKPRKQSKKETCFVISPFGGWNDRYYLEIFKPAVEDSGLQPKRADDIYRPTAIVHDIWAFVQESRVMLADLTGKNPNVFYELGLAHAIGKPVILLTQQIEDVPFDLRALRVLEYEIEDPSWSAVLRVKIKKALEEVLTSPDQAVLPSFQPKKSDGKPTAKSNLHEELTELQRQVNILSANASLRHSAKLSSREELRPDEAEAMIKDLVNAKVARADIIRFLVRRGPPTSWIEDKIAKFQHERRRRRR